MSDHRPECFYYMDDFGDGERCICDRLRACEQRVLSVAGPHNYSRGRKDGYAAALSAARDAVAASGGHSDRCICDECYGTDAALAAIDALRDQSADQTGYEMPDVRRLAADLISEYAEARHQPHAPRYDCGRCDLTAALRAAAHDIRRSS